MQLQRAESRGDIVLVPVKREGLSIFRDERTGRTYTYRTDSLSGGPTLEIHFKSGKILKYHSK